MKHLLNPHLLALGVLPDEPGECMTVAPERLVSPRRFDVAIKHIYAQHYLLGGKSSYPEKLYRAHIVSITHGSNKEDDGSKGDGDAYVAAFNLLLDSMRANGFDANYPVPVDRNMTLIDGAHRVAAALALNLPVPVVKFSHVAPAYSASMFGQQHRAAVEYCKLSPSARVVILFGALKESIKLTTDLREVVSAQVWLKSETAQDNLITELYLGESWLGDSATGYRGAAPKARPCFARGSYITVIVVDGPQAAVIDAKNAIRSATGCRDVVHATDTQNETVRVARVLFSENSIQFLHRPRKHMPRLEGLLGEYLGQIGGTDQDLLCVDGSATLAAYGLREPADLDFLHAVSVPARGQISSHNEYSKLYPMHKDDVIFDPANYFWSRGIKYATLDTVRRVKQVINEPKSIADLKLMEGL